jgi:hypothetical protein
MLTLKHGELLSQDKIFQQETATSAKKTNDGAEEEPWDLEHGSQMPRTLDGATGRKFFISKPSRVLASHKDSARKPPALRGHPRDYGVPTAQFLINSIIGRMENWPARARKRD